ncbi:MAG: type II toxin-antitoxin system death-on-curing family toxin [Patescibacteria group bacterium]
MSFHYIGLAEALNLHEQTIAATGGSFGVRDETLVDSALARPRAGFGGFEAYPDVFSKAGVLLEGLIKNHGFVDGNKRTAVVVTIIFLDRNGFRLIVERKELVNFAVRIAEDKHDTEEITAWLKKHSKLMG